MKRSTATTFFVLAAGSALAVGCGAAPELTTSDSAGAPSGVFGTVLYEKNVGPDHVIHFYEFDRGQVAIHESLSMDNGETEITGGSWKFDSLAEVYRKLNPDVQVTPSTILDADTRRVQLRVERERQRALAPVGSNPRPEPPGVSASSEPEGGASESSGVRPQLACSDDGFGDNWGANWFLDRYCNQGGFRWCQTNYAWAKSNDFSAGWTSWRQMEGDFNQAGHLFASRISCDDYWLFTSCGFRTVFADYDVRPRKIEIWTFSDGNDVFNFYGTSPCGHMHVAHLR